MSFGCMTSSVTMDALSFNGVKYMLLQFGVHAGKVISDI